MIYRKWQPKANKIIKDALPLMAANESGQESISVHIDSCIYTNLLMHIRKPQSIYQKHISLNLNCQLVFTWREMSLKLYTTYKYVFKKVFSICFKD